MNLVYTPIFQAPGVFHNSQKFPVLNEFRSTITGISEALARLSQKFQKRQENHQDEHDAISHQRSHSVDPNRMVCEEEMIKLGDNFPLKKLIIMPLPKYQFTAKKAPVTEVFAPEIEEESKKVEKISQKPIAKAPKRRIHVSSKTRSQSVIVNRTPANADIVCNACGRHGPVQVGPQHQVAVPDITIDRERDSEALKAIMANQFCESDMISPNYEDFREQLEELVGPCNEEEALQFLHAHGYDEYMCLYAVSTRSEKVVEIIEEINQYRKYRGVKPMI